METRCSTDGGYAASRQQSRCCSADVVGPTMRIRPRWILGLPRLPCVAAGGGQHHRQDDPSLPRRLPSHEQSVRRTAEGAGRVLDAGPPQSLRPRVRRGRPFLEERDGPVGSDELNLLVASANYGWPLVSNGQGYDGAGIPDHRPEDGFAAPVVSWTPVIAPSGMIAYASSRFRELARRSHPVWPAIGRVGSGAGGRRDRNGGREDRPGHADPRDRRKSGRRDLGPGGPTLGAPDPARSGVPKGATPLPVPDTPRSGRASPRVRRHRHDRRNQRRDATRRSIPAPPPAAAPAASRAALVLSTYRA